MSWTQVYDPLHNWILSTGVAALPILVLFGLLAGLRVKPHWCAIAAAGTAVVVAVTIFGMPFPLAGMSFLYGVGFGVLKIAWIVLAAVYLYDISVSTGQFEIMKESVAGITADRRLQLLLVAFCFGAFIEGAAGFGAPVAIAGAFMIGLGFKPFHAAALNLIANTSPVAWGAIGTPVHTLAAVSGLPESDLSAMVGRILPITGIIVPFWLVRAMVGWTETFEVLPAILVVGTSFSLTQYLWSNHDADLERPAAPQRGDARRAGRVQADARGGPVRFQLVLGHRDRVLRRRDHRRAGPRGGAGPAREDLLAHAEAHEARGRRHFLHVGTRVHDSLFGVGRRAGVGVHADRVAVPLLRHVSGLAGRGADGQRHVFERAVRQPAADYRRPAQARPDPHVRRQLGRWRDGQDGGRAVHHGGHLGDEPGRQ